MSTLRLGAYKLPAAEVVLVQTLFRLYAHGDAFRWTFVTAPPYDALLADGTTDEGMSPAVHVLTRADLAAVKESAQTTPPVHLTYGGYRLADDLGTAWPLAHPSSHRGHGVVAEIVVVALEQRLQQQPHLQVEQRLLVHGREHQTLQSETSLSTSMGLAM